MDAMSRWRHWRTADGFMELVDTTTGEIKKVKLASQKQIDYLNSLRLQVDKNPLKDPLTVFAAIKAIDKLVEKTRQTKLL